MNTAWKILGILVLAFLLITVITGPLWYVEIQDKKLANEVMEQCQLLKVDMGTRKSYYSCNGTEYILRDRIPEKLPELKGVKP